MRPVVPLHRCYQRTCRECGYSWEVTRAVAASGSRASSEMAANRAALRSRRAIRRRPDRAGSGSAGAVDAQRAASVRAALEALSRCARCGVSNFAQAPAHRRG